MKRSQILTFPVLFSGLLVGAAYFYLTFPYHFGHRVKAIKKRIEDAQDDTNLEELLKEAREKKMTKAAAATK